MTARELREKRANLAEQANGILTAAEGRGLTAEEQQTFDRIHADIESMRTDIDRMERQAALQAELAGQRAEPENRAQATQAERQDAAFSKWLRGGMDALTPEERALMIPAREERGAQTVTTTGGGYLIPTGFSNQLEESLLAFGGIRQACTVFKTDTGNTLNWPTVNDTAVKGRLLAINTTVTNTAVTYANVAFGAYKFSSDSVLVPLELMQDSAFDINSHLLSVLSTRIGRIENDYFTTGSGSSQPQGIVAGASSALTAAAGDDITYDEILGLIHAVDPAYRGREMGAGFMFNDGTLLKLRKMKDGEGRPLWTAGLASQAPDMIAGYPYFINQSMAAMTTGEKPILFGALKKHMVRDVKGVTLLRLVERYADDLQVGFIAFTRSDSRLLDAGTDPVKYITMA